VPFGKSTVSTALYSKTVFFSNSVCFFCNRVFLVLSSVEKQDFSIVKKGWFGKFPLHARNTSVYVEIPLFFVITIIIIIIIIIIMLLLNHELEGDFIRHSYTTTMMIVVLISIFLHNYHDDFDLQFELYCAFVIQ
jgi:hypothetical protein